MNTRHGSTYILAALAVAALGACGEEDLIFPGGPAGPAVELAISDSRLDLLVGSSFTVGAELRDEAGNRAPGDISFGACSSEATVASGGASTRENWPNTATVTAVGVGTTCVTVSGGGVTDTIRVLTGPPGMIIEGPDQIGSGEMADFTLAYFDDAGSALTVPAGFPISVTTSLAARAGIEAGSATAEGFTSVGFGPGAVRLEVEAFNGDAGATAVKVVTVVAGTFAGALSANSGGGGLVVTATRAAGGPAFDSDTEVSLGGVEPIWGVLSVSADAITFPVPLTGAAGAQELLFENLDEAQLAQKTDFTLASATEDDYAPDNFGPGGAPDLAAIQYVTGTGEGLVFFAHAGFGTGSASRGGFNGGPQPDHWFTATAGATDLALDVLVEWLDGSDVDVYVCNSAITACPYSFFSGSSENEDASGIVIPAGETYFIIVSMWSAGSDQTEMRMTINGL